MLRWVVLAAAVVIAIWLVRRSLARRGGTRADAGREGATHALVNCEHCSLLLPRGEALEDAGKFYCSEEHRRRGPAG
jgi:hypothetical protein